LPQKRIEYVGYGSISADLKGEEHRQGFFVSKEAAAFLFAEVLRQNNGLIRARRDFGIRLLAIKDGCLGKYTATIMLEPHDGDLTIKQNGIRFFIPKEQTVFFNDVEIDLDMRRTMSLRIRNRVTGIINCGQPCDVNDCPHSIFDSFQQQLPL